MIWLTSQLKCFSLKKLPRKNIKYLSSIARPLIKNSYFYKNGTIPLTSATIGNVLDRAADTYSGDTVFVSESQGISKTFSEFRNEANKLASSLLALGLRRGDRLAIYSPNCYEWPLTQFAAAKAGLILVTINFSLQSLELEYCLKKVGCKAVVTYDKLKNHDYYEILKKMLPNLPNSSPGKLQSENLPNLETIIMISDDHKEGTLQFKSLMNPANENSDILSEVETSVQCDDPVNIQFTSGTTGKPKGAVLNHHNLINNSLLASQIHGFNEMKPIICCPVPLFHTIGCSLVVMETVFSGGTCIFPCLGYDSVANLKCIEKYRCNTIFGTPTMFIDCLNRQQQLKSDISSLKKVLVGGAPSPNSLLKELSQEMKVPDTLPGYGLTETSPLVASVGLNTDFETLSTGYMEPIPNLEIKIVDNKGHIVPINTGGELCTRGFSTFLGYWDDEENTAKAIDKARWFHSGDIAVMNENGWIKIVGRIKDMVIRGGENIYVTEVENFLSLHPAVLEVHVVGVPDKRMGEELCSWISVKPEMTLTEEEIRSYCKGQISDFKIPRYVLFVDEFPKTTSGKVKKHEMVKISAQKLNL